MMTLQLKLLLIGLAAVSGLYGCNQNPQSSPEPQIQNGVLDLRDWNLKKDGLVKLNGEWEFYWNRIIDPFQFKEDKPAYTFVPGIWNHFQVQGKKIGGQGYATYRLVIQLPPTSSDLGLKLPSIVSAYRLFADGKELTSVGTLGTQKNLAEGRYLPKIVPVHFSGGDLELVFQVSNFDHRAGGIWETIEFGDMDQIIKSREIKIGAELFLFGVMLIMAITHFGLFTLRSRDRSLLYFGFICLILGLNTLMTGERFLASYFNSFPIELWLKLEFLEYTLAPIFFILFFLSEFPKESLLLLGRILLVFYSVISLIILVTPAIFFTNTILITNPLLLVLGASGIYTLIVAIKDKRQSALIFLIGYLVFFVTIVNDVLNAHGYIITGTYFAFGLLFFIFSQSFALSFKSARDFLIIQDVSGKLFNLNKTLEQKVAERTDQLSVKNKQLKILLHVLRHDLYNPFANIKSVLLVGREDPEFFRNLSEPLTTAVDNGMKLIELIRQLELLEAENFILETKPHQLNLLIQESISILDQRFKEKNIRLKQIIDESHYIRVEKVSFINSVLNNLLTNAIKFSYPDSEIQIQSEIKNGRLLLTIADKGIGIPEILLQQIYELDRFSSRNGTSGESGTGFGMLLVKRFIQAYGGELEIKSKDEENFPQDHGTMVTLLLQY